MWLIGTKTDRGDLHNSQSNCREKVCSVTDLADSQLRFRNMDLTQESRPLQNDKRL